MVKKYYAVKTGRKTGVFNNWEECRESVEGYSGAEYKAFKTELEAFSYLSIEFESEKKRPAYTHSGNYLIYTDGGCNFNPGGRGGYGVVMLDLRTGETREFSEGFLSTTNNRMEIMAVLRAVIEMEPGTSADIYSDSQYTINCMQGIWKKSKNLDLWAKLDKAQQGKKLAMHWIKGHNGDLYNERCDQMATDAMGDPNLRIDEGYQELMAKG